MYWSDLGFGGDPIYKEAVVGWYGMGQPSLVDLERLRFGMRSGFGDESG